MQIEKIVLVELTPLKVRPYIGRLRTDPFASQCLGAAVNEAGYKVKIIQQTTESDQELIEKVSSEKPDLVGFSSFTFNFKKTKDIARIIKTKNPGLRTIFGGYHVSARPQEVADESIDYTIMGEGEQTLVQLIETINKNKELKGISGLAFKRDNGVVWNRANPILDVDKLPPALRSEEWSSTMNFAYPITSLQKGATIYYSRGCSFSCSYCILPQILGRNIRHRSAEKVVDEMESLQSNHNINYFAFIDSTFNANRQKVLDLCDEIDRRDLSANWSTSCRPIPDKELYQRMVHSGCNRITFGIEFSDPEALKCVNRMSSPEEALNIILEVSSLRTFVRGFYMLGNPDETCKDFNEYVSAQINFVKKLAKAGLDYLRISFMTPFPGTEIFDEYKRRGVISSFNWDSYTTEIPIVNHFLGPEELVRARNAICRGFYKSEEYQRHMQEKIRKYPEFEASYSEFFKFLKEKHFSD